MCDVMNCDEKPYGQETTTFGNNILLTKLCRKHFEDYKLQEDYTHTHEWSPYPSSISIPLRT